MVGTSGGPMQSIPEAHMDEVVKVDRLQDTPKPSCNSYVQTEIKYYNTRHVHAITEQRILLKKL
jgi:hypothetical protein